MEPEPTVWLWTRRGSAAEHWMSPEPVTARLPRSSIRKRRTSPEPVTRTSAMAHCDCERSMSPDPVTVASNCLRSIFGSRMSPLPETDKFSAGERSCFTASAAILTELDPLTPKMHPHPQEHRSTAGFRYQCSCMRSRSSCTPSCVLGNSLH